MDLTFKNYSLQKNGITQSLLSTFLRCRKAFLYSVNKITPDITGLTMGYSFGSFMHEMLDELYSGVKLNKLGYDKYIKKNPYPDAEKDAGLIETILKRYVDVYVADFKDKKFIKTEQEFDVDWHSFKLRGKIDGVYRDKKDKLWLIEHKTKSRINEDDLMLQLTMDSQNLFYILAAEIIFGEPVQGVLYNIIRKPGHKQTQKETLKEFCSRVGNIIDNEPDHFFLRFEIPYTKKDKREFNDELVEKLIDVKAVRVGSLGCYRNQGACLLPFKCKYLNLCATGKMNGYKIDKKLFSELNK